MTIGQATSESERGKLLLSAGINHWSSTLRVSLGLVTFVWTVCLLQIGHRIRDCLLSKNSGIGYQKKCA